MTTHLADLEDLLRVARQHGLTLDLPADVPASADDETGGHPPEG